MSELAPRYVIGVGAFATRRIEHALSDKTLAKLTVGTVLHPSPASPLANRGWAERAEADLRGLGVALPD